MLLAMYTGAELGGIQPSLLNIINSVVHAIVGGTLMLLKAIYPTEPIAVVVAVPVKGPTIKSERIAKPIITIYLE